MADCPDFDLAPFHRFNRRVFAEQRNPVDGFVLVLALAYNDLKDVMWVMQQLHKCEPAPGIEPAFGQWMGMRLSATRQILRILHELLESIKEANSNGSLADPVLVYALDKTSEGTQSAWQELLQLSQDRAKHKVGKFVLLARNTLASHFDWKVLSDGYATAFHRPTSRGEHNEYALASLGATLASTRFHFADAAAQKALDNIAQQEDLMPELDEYIEAMLRALTNVVEAYLRVKDEPTHLRRASGTPAGI